jgi:IS605 OrfB family transposase
LKPVFKFSEGCLGIDTNPDGLAVVEINKDGNLLGHTYLSNSRIQFARHDKRKNDIEVLALQVVNMAVLKGKGIVLEDLKFNQNKKSKCKKFNRMKHNFIYASLLQAIERRAIKDGVEVRKVNPAFTSIAGILKYQDLYSLNRHTVAALVIARRGYGIMETVRVKLESLEKDRLNLAGRDRSIALTKKAYSYFKHLYRVFEVETPAVTPPCLTPISGNYGTG